AGPREAGRGRGPGRRPAPARRGAAADGGVPAGHTPLVGAIPLFYPPPPVVDYAGAKTADTARFGTFFRNMRDRGVFLPPSQFEAMFVSLAHTDGEIDQVIAAARASLGVD